MTVRDFYTQLDNLKLDIDYITDTIFVDKNDNVIVNITHLSNIITIEDWEDDGIDIYEDVTPSEIADIVYDYDYKMPYLSSKIGADNILYIKLNV